MRLQARFYEWLFVLVKHITVILTHCMHADVGDMLCLVLRGVTGPSHVTVKSVPFCIPGYCFPLGIVEKLWLTLIIKALLL